MQKIVTLITVVALVLAGLLIGPSFIDWNKYKPMAVTKISETTGLDVTLNGDISLAVLPAPHIRIKDVTVKAPSDSAETPLAKLDSLKIDLALAPLFSRQVVANSIILDKPQINISTNTQGKANWQTAEIEAQLNKSKTGAEQENTKEKSFAVVLNQVEINDGYLALTDEKNKKTTRIENLNLKLKTDNLKGPMDIDTSLKFNSANIKVDGQFTMPDKTSKSAPAKFEAEIDGAKLVFDGTLTTATPFDIKGTLAADITSLNTALAAFNLSPVPAQFNAFKTKGTLDANLEKFTYSDMTFATKNGQTSGKVSGVRNPESGAMTINLALDSLPGGGNINGDVTIQKDAMSFKAKGKAQSIASVMEFVGTSAPANLPFTSATFDASGKKSGETLMFNESTFSLDDMPITLSGSMTKRSSGKDLLNVKVSTDRLDLVSGKFAPKPSGSEQKAEAGSKPSLPKISLPFDLNFDVAANKLITKQGEINNFAAKGNLTGNTLKLTDLNIDDLAGAKIGARGTIGNLENLSDLNLKVDLNTQDIHNTLAALKPGMKGIPPAVKKLELSSNINGSLNSLKLDTTAKTIGATFDVSTTVKDPMTKPQIGALDVRTRHPNASDFIHAFAPTAPSYVSLKRPMDISTTSITLQDNAISVGKISGDLAGATVNGSLNIATGSATPSINGALRFGNLTLKTSGTAQSTQSSGGSAKSSGGRWSTAKFNTAWLSASNIDLDIAADSLVYETWNLSSPKLNFKLGSGALNIRDLNTGLYGGSASLNGTVTATPNGLSLALSPDLKNIQIEPLVQSAVGRRVLSGSGSISFNGTFNGTGGSQKELVSNLNGNGAATGSTIVINGLDISKFISSFSGDIKAGTSALGLLESTGRGGATKFDTLDGAYTMTNGVATLSKLDLDGAQASMTSRGTVNLPNWTMNTEHTFTAKNTEDMPSFTIRLNGPLDNPARGLAEGAINNYLQKKLGKKLQKILGDKLGETGGGEVGNVINNLLGLPTQQQQAPAPTAPAPAEQQQAPANDNVAPAPQQQEQPRQQTPEEAAQEAVRGLIQGLF